MPSCQSQAQINSGGCIRHKISGSLFIWSSTLCRSCNCLLACQSVDRYGVAGWPVPPPKTLIVVAPAHPYCPAERAVKRVCYCGCIRRHKTAKSSKFSSLAIMSHYSRIENITGRVCTARSHVKVKVKVIFRRFQGHSVRLWANLHF